MQILTHESQYQARLRAVRPWTQQLIQKSRTHIIELLLADTAQFTRGMILRLSAALHTKHSDRTYCTLFAPHKLSHLLLHRYPTMVRKIPGVSRLRSSNQPAVRVQPWSALPFTVLSHGLALLVSWVVTLSALIR